ncbi:phage terminase small subunit [Clostridium formicaceticum]|uniref:Terminase n=1 Tax=Clostridium formicaceticum TaxID=1497 RepID=A0AAC9RL91_9CLOT|nr:phage terminase small subunit [Clostridium formicaceticum]AOY77203.1 hypothetical protein BJL90_15910 [Clostridium formicaceticum]ARE87727.1 hypothetical protein CLFO_21270 [Clostridium formicaceticum]
MSNDTKWLEIKKEYLRRTVDGEKVVLSELAEKYGVKTTTLRSRKSREKWDDFLENVATHFDETGNDVATYGQEKSNTDKDGPKKKDKKSQNKTNSIKRRIGQLGNKNAVGNCNRPPKGNKRAEKHGFYSKHLPDETMELFDELEEINQLDLLWDSIRLKYAAIVRAQKIMFVKDRDDITEYLKKHKVIKGMSFTEEKEWEFQFAWDKYATFLQAQSRAMGELRSLIKSYNELVDRGMATKEQELRIQKLQVEIDNMKGEEVGKETEDWVKAIEQIAAKRRGKDG